MPSGHAKLSRTEVSGYSNAFSKLIAFSVFAVKARRVPKISLFTSTVFTTVLLAANNNNFFEEALNNTNFLFLLGSWKSISSVFY